MRLYIGVRDHTGARVVYRGGGGSQEELDAHRDVYNVSASFDWGGSGRVNDGTRQLAFAILADHTGNYDMAGEDCEAFAQCVARLPETFVISGEQVTERLEAIYRWRDEQIEDRHRILADKQERDREEFAPHNRHEE